MPESVDPLRNTVRATKEIVVNIHGEEFDCLLIPRKPFIQVDYTRYPENDPFKRELNVAQMVEVHLERDVDLEYAVKGDGAYKLTEHGARRLLDSL